MWLGIGTLPFSFLRSSTQSSSKNVVVWVFTERWKLQNNWITVFSIMHMQLAPANYDPNNNTSPRPPATIAVRLPWINTVLLYSDARPPSATFESDRLRTTNGLMNECSGSWFSLDRPNFNFYIHQRLNTVSPSDSHWRPPRASYDVCKLTASTNHIRLYIWPLVWNIDMSDLANDSAWVIEQTTPGFLRHCFKRIGGSAWMASDYEYSGMTKCWSTNRWSHSGYNVRE